MLQQCYILFPFHSADLVIVAAQQCYILFPFHSADLVIVAAVPLALI